MTKENFLHGMYKKLKMKKIAHCNIMKKILDNAYVLQLPTEIDISPIFNVVYLHDYHEVVFEKDNDVITN